MLKANNNKTDNHKNKTGKTTKQPLNRKRKEIRFDYKVYACVWVFVVVVLLRSVCRSVALIVILSSLYANDINKCKKCRSLKAICLVCCFYVFCFGFIFPLPNFHLMRFMEHWDKSSPSIQIHSHTHTHATDHISKAQTHN